MPCILVVDDEAQNLDLLEAALEPAGYTVRRASGGLPALRAARTDPPDLILLDVMMPGMNGFEICRRLRAEPATSRVPVIFATALGQIGEAELFAACAGDDYLFKPIQVAEVLARVEASLALAHLHRELEQSLERMHALELDRHAHRRQALSRTGVGPGTSLEPDRGAGPRILLVGAEGAEREYYTGLLVAGGFKVTAESDEAKGLGAARRTAPAAALLDLAQSPAALATLARFRAELPDLPIVVLAASPDGPAAVTAIESGASDSVAKGLHPDRLLAAIRRAARAGGPRPAA
jgi:DNA-binding response OmpR family regulator